MLKLLRSILQPQEITDSSDKKYLNKNPKTVELQQCNTPTFSEFTDQVVISTQHDLYFFKNINFNLLRNWKNPTAFCFKEFRSEGMFTFLCFYVLRIPLFIHYGVYVCVLSRVLHQIILFHKYHR